MVYRIWGWGKYKIVNYARWVSSRDPVYKILSIVSNRELCASKSVERLELMLSVFTTKANKQNKQKNREHKETLDGVWYIYIRLILVMVTHTLAYTQTHQIIYLKMYSSWYMNYTSIKLFKKWNLFWEFQDHKFGSFEGKFSQQSHLHNHLVDRSSDLAQN